MSKTYDVVKEILEQHPVTRNSDKALMWRFWLRKGHVQLSGGDVKQSYMNWFNFAQCASPESITRARRKVQELHPELQATKPIEQHRRKKAETGGNFVFHE